jgi:hypothetical protein
MLKLSKEGMKDEAEVINQMLMPLHERYGMQHTVCYGHRHHSSVYCSLYAHIIFFPI